VANSAIHFEIIGKDPDALRKFYGELFDWSFDVGGSTSAAVSEPGRYGFMAAPDGANPTAFGIGGGGSFSPHTILYISVLDIETCLAKAERLGGERVIGPEKSPGTPLTIGQFRDPEGNLVGLAQIDP
jgi:uncharacterized protein